MEMNTQFIMPLQRIETLSEQNITAVTKDNSFTNIFENAVNDVKATQMELDTQQYLLAIGEIDDPHNVTIAAANAQLSVDLLVQLRNGAIEAYNELIKTNL